MPRRTWGESRTRISWSDVDPVFASVIRCCESIDEDVATKVFLGALPFELQARMWTRRGSNPQLPRSRRWNPDLRLVVLVELEGVAPSSPQCHCGVLLLNYSPKWCRPLEPPQDLGVFNPALFSSSSDGEMWRPLGESNPRSFPRQGNCDASRIRGQGGVPLQD